LLHSTYYTNGLERVAQLKKLLWIFGFL
jgi:hypothetical protein